MKVKIIWTEFNDHCFENGWVSGDKVYNVTRKHHNWDDAYYIIDDEGDEVVYFDNELEFMED